MSRRSVPRTVAAALALPAGLIAGLAAGCGDDPPAVSTAQAALVVPPTPLSAIDVLVVIDDSLSMLSHQELLVGAAQTALLDQLTDELGELPDLHLGVVKSSMPLPNAACPSVYDPGALHLEPGCTALTQPFLSDAPDGAGGRTRNYQGSIDEAMGCLARVGTDGCGFEMPFAAMQAALGGTVAGNAGFLRDDALLLVVFVTDEDDCSALDFAFTDPDNDAAGPLSSFRCFEHAVVCDGDDPRVPGAKTGCRPREDGPATPIADVVAFLTTLKQDDPTRVMVAGLTASPTRPGEVEVGLDVNGAPYLVPTCDTENGGAAPAIRVPALAAQFPARFELGDVCATLGTELAAVSRAAGRVMGGSPCLAGALADADAAQAGVQPSCQAFDVSHPMRADERRVAVPSCAASGGAEPCVDLVADAAACAGTATELAAVYRGARPAGTHLVVDCQR